MTATMKSLVFAAFALSATAQAADQRWEVEGAYPAFPGTPNSGIASLSGKADATVAAAKAAPAAEKTAAKAATTGCNLKVELLSLHAVGAPCATTTDVMNQLGLSAKAQARVEHLANAPKAAKAKAAKKTAH